VAGRVIESADFYLEDFEVGAVYRTMGRTVTSMELTMFIWLGGYFVPQFVDLDFARNETQFKGRLVPGPLVFVLSEGLFVLAGRVQNAIAWLGADGVRMHAPVFCDDTIHGEVTVKAVRRLDTGNRGIVTTLHAVLNQRGETVMSYESMKMYAARSSGETL
jgi:acyl dehydratase